MPCGLDSSSAEAHQSGLAALALNQSGSLVATASETGTVRGAQGHGIKMVTDGSGQTC